MTHRSMLPGGTNRPSRPHSSRRHISGTTSVRRLLASLAAVLPVVLAFQLTTSLLPAAAVDATGQFCMDGNIEPGLPSFTSGATACPATTPPYTWSSLFNASGTPLVTHATDTHLLDSTFIQDYATPDQSYFTQNGAGVKDTDAIANWGCKTQNNPLGKDDIQDAYAAVFRVPAGAPENAGDIVAYLGVERLSNLGDSFAGFWLFKNPQVSCSGSGGFSGTHSDGDILILTNFTNGGSMASVSVFRWMGNDATGSLNTTAIASGNVCSYSPGGTGGESVCAISNAPAPSSTMKCTDSSLTINSPWVPTSVAGCTFTEAAIDLTQLFGPGGTASGPCFSNFMAETRSSQQVTATLKDFAGGLLNTCETPAVSTSASGHGNNNLPGSTQFDTATMNVAGGDPTPTGSVTFFLCGPTQVTSAGCPKGAGAQVGTAVTLTSGSAQSPNVTDTTTPNDLTTGTYCWGAQYTPDSASINTYLPSYGTDATHECFVIAKATPQISTTAAFSSGSSDLSSSPALSDTVTLMGAATGSSGAPAGETVSFSLFGPYAAGTTPSCATGTHEPVFTTTGTLAKSGSNYTATTASSYTPTAVGTYVWEASYAADAYNNAASEGCNGANESLSITTPQLHITKLADNATVSAGSPIGFTITVSNDAAATGSATGVSISDPLPGGSGIEWAIASQSAHACALNTTPPQTLSCAVGTLAPGGSYFVHVTSGTDASSCTQYTNTATASATNETNPDVMATASTTVQCPNISITKTADHGTVNAGDPIGFTVTISNSGVAGTGTASNVSISDPLPAGTGIDWGIASQSLNDCTMQGSVGGQSVDCTIASLAPGASYTFDVTSATQYASCAEYDNTASATVGNENGGPFTAGAIATVQCPGLHITKTADATPVSTGSPIGFHVTVSNSNAAGTGTAINVTMDDPLPAGTGVFWMIAIGGDPLHECTITGSAGSQDLQCSLGNMAPGASYEVAISSTTNADSAGTYPNTASAKADNAPKVTASATIVVLAPDVTVTKTADHGTVNAGAPIGFTVTISNPGDAGTVGTATGVTVADPLPMGSGISWSIDHQWANNCMITVTDGGTPGQELDCLAFNLAPGASHTVHVTSVTSYQSCSVYNNTANVTVPNQTPDSLSASASTTVQCPDLDILKTADATPVSTGTPIGFSITVSNGGPGTANDVTLNDPLPSGSGINWSVDSNSDPSTTTCTITVSHHTQHLQCTLGNMAAGDSVTIHITSNTDSSSAGTYPNTATVTSSNAPTQQSSATIVVLGPALSITKTADQTPVAAGTGVGFTITVTNSSLDGTGTATGVTISDPLPSADSVSWSISPAYAGPGTCSIAGTTGNQTLSCSLGDMEKGATASVHITSSTSNSTCDTIDNTASVAASNAAGSQASASIGVICVQVLGVSVVVPATGLGILVPSPAVALLASGIILIMGVVIRRRRTSD